MDNILADQLTLCKLAGAHKSYDRILNEAKEQNWGFEEFFTKLIDLIDSIKKLISHC